MCLTKFELKLILIFFVFALLSSCTGNKNDNTANSTQATQNANIISQTATTATAVVSDEEPEYCDRIVYRYLTRDVQPFATNPCKHPMGPKCSWQQVRFHISGPSNNDYKLIKTTIDEGAHLTFGDCRTCRPNGTPKTTSTQVDWLMICDGSEQTGILTIEVVDKATGKVFGTCDRKFKFKETPPCPTAF